MNEKDVRIPGGGAVDVFKRFQAERHRGEMLGVPVSRFLLTEHQARELAQYLRVPITFESLRNGDGGQCCGVPFLVKAPDVRT